MSRSDAELATIVSRMEDEIHEVQCWGDVLRCLGTTPGHLPPDAVFVIGGVMQELGRSLDEQWKLAFKLSRVEVKP